MVSQLVSQWIHRNMLINLISEKLSPSWSDKLLLICWLLVHQPTKSVDCCWSTWWLKPTINKFYVLMNWLADISWWTFGLTKNQCGKRMTWIKMDVGQTLILCLLLRTQPTNQIFEQTRRFNQNVTCVIDYSNRTPWGKGPQQPLHGTCAFSLVDLIPLMLKSLCESLITGHFRKNEGKLSVFQLISLDVLCVKDWDTIAGQLPAWDVALSLSFSIFCSLCTYIQRVYLYIHIHIHIICIYIYTHSGLESVYI